MQDVLVKLQKYTDELSAAETTTSKFSWKNGPHPNSDRSEPVAGSHGSDVNIVPFQTKALSVRMRLAETMLQLNRLLADTAVALDDWRTAELAKAELSQWLTVKNSAVRRGSLSQSEIQVCLFLYVQNA
jgi:hypothetical protein